MTSEVVIRLPGVAKKTFENLKDQTFYRKITKGLVKKLRKAASPVKRARLAHRLIDEKLQKLFQDKTVQKHVKCSKGCTACCHTQVSVTEEEAQLLAQRVKEGVEIDYARLKEQANAGSSPESWYKKPYESRACVFLGENGECRVYEDRPSVCRTNFVVSDPYFCSTKDGKVRNVRLLNTFEADMAVAGLFFETESSGTLPQKLYEALGRKKKKVAAIHNLPKLDDFR